MYKYTKQCTLLAMQNVLNCPTTVLADNWPRTADNGKRHMHKSFTGGQQFHAPSYLQITLGWKQTSETSAGNQWRL